MMGSAYEFLPMREKPSATLPEREVELEVGSACMPSLDLRNHAIPLFFFFFFFFLDATRNGDFISEMYGSLLLKCP